MHAVVMSLLVATASFAVPAVAAPAPRVVTVYAPSTDSPGARIPVIVTLHDAPSSASGAGLQAYVAGHASHSAGNCGMSWRNQVARTLSRKCYISLPRRAGKVLVKGAADYDGVRVTSRAVRVKAAGPVSSRYLSIGESRMIERCYNTSRTMWLSFDDFVRSDSDARSLVRVARQNNVKLHFFLNRVTRSQRRILEAAGMIVGDHTKNHLLLPALSRSAIHAEIVHGPRTTKHQRRLLRLPFGAGALSYRVRTVIRAAGYRPCRWTVDSRDWAGASAAQIRTVMRYGNQWSEPASPGGVVLLHASHFSPAKLRAAIAGARARGVPLERLR